MLRAQSTGVEDASFQQLLLEFSTAAAKAVSAPEILKLFCRETRRYFRVSGSYVWQFVPPDQMIGAEADGWMAEHFRNANLKTSESAIGYEAIHKKRAVCLNALNTSRSSLAAEFHAQA